jgi:hypothetical protein
MYIYAIAYSVFLLPVVLERMCIYMQGPCSSFPSLNFMSAYPINHQLSDHNTKVFSGDPSRSSIAMLISTLWAFEIGPPAVTRIGKAHGTFLDCNISQFSLLRYKSLLLTIATPRSTATKTSDPAYIHLTRWKFSSLSLMMLNTRAVNHWHASTTVGSIRGVRDVQSGSLTSEP